MPMKARTTFRVWLRLRFVPAALALGALLMLPAAQGADPVAAKSIVVLGDSLAAGLGVDPSESFPSLIQNKIDSAGWNYRVVNAGVSGDTSADGLARIDWLLKQRIDVLVLELGGNDGWRGIRVAATKTNLQADIHPSTHKYPQARTTTHAN